ncbi:MAG: hypothetical protein K0R46_2331 [Herbinix sp.]|nr:hypothetical protein [Herbinix sp.]
MLTINYEFCDLNHSKRGIDTINFTVNSKSALRKETISMSEKQIDLSKSVYELCNQYPELPQILSEIGFTDIIRPGMLASVGRFMTIPKGATGKKIDLEKIKISLREHGFEIKS